MKSRFVRHAALQILAIATAITAVCALPDEQMHRFHFVNILMKRSTSLNGFLTMLADDIFNLAGDNCRLTGVVL
ncbi:MAG: hypothetical protein JSS31_17070 [Proteobacteria bacterium]|nr:hypothetical protein [Pseudomonadota bacterium]MBS0495616.1 hypothetical protein [Pseudomonadota bacterium]